MLSDDTTIQREFSNLLEIPDNYPKYVVTMDEMQSGGNYQGIKQISLRDFLLAEDKENIKSSLVFLWTVIWMLSYWYSKKSETDFCVKMYILSIKMSKGQEEGIAYLCHVGKWIP